MESDTTLTSPASAGEEAAAESPQNVLPCPQPTPKRPHLPSYTAEQLRDMGVIANPTEHGVFVEIPFSVQKQIITDVSGFGFIAPGAMNQVIQNVLGTLGLTGKVNVKNDLESFAFQAWTDSRDPKPEAVPEPRSSTNLTTKELLELHDELCAAGRAIMESKNHDYTDGSVDPFANFRTSEILGVPAETGVLIRSLDKFKRVQTFVNKGTLKVKGESVKDAIIDVINYMVLCYGIILGR